MTSMYQLACAALVSALTGANEKAATPDYQHQVVPIFRKYCLGCHRADKAEGNLVMETYESLQEGGHRGKSLIPGKSGESLLILSLSGKKKPFMPPKGNPKPTADEIAVLARWIDAGAKGPSGPSGGPGELVTTRIEPKTPVRPPINAVAIAPKGDLVAVARGNSVLLVDFKSAVIRQSLGGHPGPVTSVAFATDGSRLVTAAGEPGLFGEARLWNAADGKLLQTFKGHRDSLYAAELSPDTKLVATAGYDREITLWNAADGKPVRTLKGHNDPVFALAFRRDGRLVASAAGDRTVKLWDVTGGKRLDTFSQPLKEQYALAIHPDGKRLAAAGVDNRVRVWSLSDSAQEGTNPLVLSRFAHESPIIKLVYSPDGKTLVSSAEDRTIKLWDADSLKERVLLERQPDWAPALAVSPDSQSLLVGRHNGSLAVYHLSSGSKARDFVPTPPPPVLASIAPMGIERAKPVRIRVAGQQLAGATEVRGNHPKLHGRVVEASSPTTAQIELTAAADLARGTYQIALVGPGGVSGNVNVHVDDLPQHQEAEPNNLPQQATRLALPASIWGAIERAGDVDHIAFDLRKGQTIVIDAAAGRLGSKLNGLVTLFDPAGRAVVSANDFDGQPDPLLAYTAPADGVYVMRLADLQTTGGADRYYRLSIGTFAYVTGVHPLAVPPGATTNVELSGFNLPQSHAVAVKAGQGGEIDVPVDPERFRFRQTYRVAVSELPITTETEPNDAPERAITVPAPGAAVGRLWSGTRAEPDVDFFKFSAKAGEEWIIETEAARRGAPTDTRIEVLDHTGKSMERTQLYAVRDSMVAFRGINSTQLEVRVENWQEMELNEYLYLQGEVVKLFRMPQGPDSGFVLYGVGGQRLTYFDTSAATHALEDPCYIVQPHPPGTKLVPNGLPVFPVYYANDDSADRKIGTDSRVFFAAPAPATYLVRVEEARGRNLDRCAYRLVVRRPKPDFHVHVAAANPTVDAGSGKEIRFEADRVDGFDGPIRIDVADLPTGFRISTPVVIEAGHRAASAVLTAEPAAAAPAAQNATKVTATATIAGSPITKPAGSLGTIRLGAKPKLRVRMEPAEVTIVPGGTAVAMLKVERNGFDGRVEFDVANLPHGVIVDNIGLNGILIPEKQTERQIFFAARKWVSATSRPCFAVARTEGNPAAPAITLHVKPTAQLVQAKKD